MAYGESMGDSYRMVTLSSAWAGYAEGDVVRYDADGGERVQHRLVERSRGGWLTEGDNNPTIDQRGPYGGQTDAVTDRQIVDRVLLTVPVYQFRAVLFLMGAVGVGLGLSANKQFGEVKT